MSSYPNTTYTLTLNANQRKAAERAVRLFLDLKDQNPEVLFSYLASRDEECYKEREESIKPFLQKAFRFIYNGEGPKHDEEYNDLEWLLDQIVSDDYSDGLIITMTTPQAHTFFCAIELLLRLKLDQPGELFRTLVDISDADYCERRDDAEHFLQCAFRQIFPTVNSARKDDEWYRLYNIFQVVRYAFFEVENPNSKGVDSDPPRALCCSDMLPTITYKKG